MTENDITLISFYTEEYEKYLDTFLDTAERLRSRLNCNTYVEKKLDWEPKENEVRSKNRMWKHDLNCKWKPSVIENALLKNNNICLWMDIDCEIKKINFIPENFDIGYSTNVPDWYTNRISVGWIWLNNTLNTKMFLSKWKEYLHESQQDHNAFTRAYYEMRDMIKFVDVTDSMEIHHNAYRKV